MKRNKGITLIALVVTIIVLIILAGVSINLILGENGIIQKAKLGKTEAEKASAKERIEMEVLGSYNDEGKLLANNIVNNIKKNIPEAIIEQEEFPIIVTLDGKSFEIDEKGNVKLRGARPYIKEGSINITLENGNEIPEDGVDEGTKMKIDFVAEVEGGSIVSISPNIPYITQGNEKEVEFIITAQANGESYSIKIPISLKEKYKKNEFLASDIAKKPTEFYGSMVTNYLSNSTTPNWRIFYADESNIYLIVDDYISVNDVPKGANGENIITPQGGGNNYRMALCHNSYYSTGSAWILGQTNGKDNSLAKKWLNGYLEKNPTSKEQNMAAVASLLDTSIWSKFVDNNYAEYAIGGPTIEMYSKSYKETHPNVYMSWTVKENTFGYNVTWNQGNGGNIVEKDYNNIYIKELQKAQGVWLASPDISHQYNIGYVCLSNSEETTKGTMTATQYYGAVNNGLRPIVCLNSDIQLEKIADGQYKIKDNI